MRQTLAKTAALLLIGGSLLAYGGAKAADASDESSQTKPGAVDLSSFPSDLDGEIKRVQALRLDGKLDDAVRSLGQMMLVAPDDPRVVGEYGKVLVLQNRPQDATAFLKRSIELQAGDWTLYSALGIAYDEQGDSRNAKSAYERALVLKPGEASVLNNYALSRKAAGDVVSARQMIAEAQASGGGDATIARNYALLTPANTSAPAAPVNVAQAPVATHANASAVSVASLAPVTSSPAAAGAPAAISAPRQIGVVMQRVPVDPLAGPVKAHGKVKVAAKAGKPAVASKKSKTPTLRMSADAS
jgi:Flp pilus assembly protein TadD